MKSTDISAFMKSPKFVPVLVAIGCVIIAVFIFEAGVAVGFHKAEFAEHWEDNYEANFGSPRGALGMPGHAIPNGHGAAGRILSVSLPTFVIAGPAGEDEKVVRLTDDTIIRNGADTVTAASLTTGQAATVIGMPNDAGEIVATFIRLMPPKAASTTTATTTAQ